MYLDETWIQILSLFLANAALIVWFRAESRSDWRHMDNKLEASKSETQLLIKAIHAEMKDFHDRLLEIEITKKLKTDP